MEPRKPRLFQRPAFRVFALLFLVVVAFAAVQQSAVPESFGAFGYYRGDNVQEWTNLSITYSEGSSKCGTCHSSTLAAWQGQEHGGINCESCHEAAAEHTINPGQTKPLKDISREFCASCHQPLQGRTTSAIRQVNLEQHNPGNACAVCHDPHSPWAKLGGGRPK